MMDACATGALMIVSGDGEWLPECKSVSSAWMNGDQCQSMTLTDLFFESNAALGAGGAIFVPDMRRIHMAHNERSEMTKLSSMELQKATNFGFKGNIVSPGGFGNDIASDVAMIKFISERPTPMHQVSGKMLPEIDVEIVDWHGQRITSGIPSAG